ncbi:MAG: hypothetical protein J2P57_22955 [Acidimicrobiaceae bacterium]|nr:hypothetical protein [Acidimicrobiaceae bacterium]
MTPTAETFEDRLLDALLDRFDNLASQPPAAIAPVQRRANIRRYAVPLTGLAIGATAASLAFVEIGGPTVANHAGPAPTAQPSASAYALAAWTAKPTSADPAQISAAEDRCSPSVGQVGTPPRAPGDKQGPPLAAGQWSPLLVDTRGNLTLALYSHGTATMACLAGPTFVWLNPLDTSGQRPVTDNTASLDEVTVRGAAGDTYTIAIGRSGSAVTGVGLQRLDGSEVTATVSNGRFIAWWPASEGVKALSVTTSTGTHDYPVDQRFARSHPQPANKTVHNLPNQPNNKAN